jgi:hypothetical protein
METKRIFKIRSGDFFVPSSRYKRYVFFVFFVEIILC